MFVQLLAFAMQQHVYAITRSKKAGAFQFLVVASCPPRGPSARCSARLCAFAVKRIYSPFTTICNLFVLCISRSFGLTCDGLDAERLGSWPFGSCTIADQSLPQNISLLK